MVGISTASSGPAGIHFEGQVAASYLLSMLSASPPRGLPGTSIQRVALQQANAGYPLDDVIIHARCQNGDQATLEIQVKRGITFSRQDPVFGDVVRQIVKTARRVDFFSARHELAIATARGSTKIDGSYQAVLKAARDIGDPGKFFDMLRLKGAANQAMRDFVQTFRELIKEEGGASDDASVWQLLRKLHILVFDFTSPGSASQDLSIDRATRVLHPNDIQKAGAFWSNLIELALDKAIGGGDFSNETLRSSLLPLGYQFAGELRHKQAIAVVAEMSRLALEDIDNKVGQSTLTRAEYIAAVNDSLDQGRYIEIRGEAGVGKSGILRHFAEQMAAEGTVIVLSPGRCPSNWLDMRNQLGFESDIKALLSELAINGGSALFIDNLDSFLDNDKVIAKDLIREACKIPGFRVIVTARISYGVDEPNWLPTDALARLGQANAIVIKELSESELDELKAHSSSLAYLLSHGHPAKSVVRNLFRLNQLLKSEQKYATLLTEVAMASRWWETGGDDGRSDAYRRERSRLLRALAHQALKHNDHLDTSNYPPDAVDILIRAGVLRELRGERVAFRHDAFRDWAIANLLMEDPTLIDNLHIEVFVPAILLRGIDLFARMNLEGLPGAQPWNMIVLQFTQPRFHPTWRRTALLAITHSEISPVLLDRNKIDLLANDAALLCEILRTIKAVETIPATQIFNAIPLHLPSNLNIPNGPAWDHLISWLLELSDEASSILTPNIIDFYLEYVCGTLGFSPLTPRITSRLYEWLRKLEPTREPLSADKTNLFRGLGRAQIELIQKDLRSGFLVFCKSTPHLAIEYLHAIEQCDPNNNIVRYILKFPGSLPEAAPTELARLIKKALIPQPGIDSNSYHRSPFAFLMNALSPPSPKGPFLELLNHSPRDGLWLIHSLVDHAIAFHSKDKEPSTDSINIQFENGVRQFPWVRSYLWSRTSEYCGVTAALMALEAWSHRRIDANEPFDTVLKDVLGPPGSPAAYLLIAVDLIISHWPKSMNMAARFFGCANLLCHDFIRSNLDANDSFHATEFEHMKLKLPGMDLGLNISTRISRRFSLHSLIGNHTLLASEQQRNRLAKLLSDEITYWGSPLPDDQFDTPAFMAGHAFNLANLANYKPIQTQAKDGSFQNAHQYMPPVNEQLHMRAILSAFDHEDSSIQILVSCINDPARFTLEQRMHAIKWALAKNELKTIDADDGNFKKHQMKEAILAAAMIAMRDDDIENREKYHVWAHGQFIQALQLEDNSSNYFTSGLRSNSLGITYVGLTNYVKHFGGTDNIQLLFEISRRPGVSEGFGASISTLNAINPRLPQALMRYTFYAAIQPNRDLYAMHQQNVLRNESLQNVLAAEISWLFHDGVEPHWPMFPQEKIFVRRHIRIHGKVFEIADDADEQTTHYIEHQYVASWLRQFLELSSTHEYPWLYTVVQKYLPWTITANGGGLDPDEDDNSSMRKWNHSFFPLIIRCLPGMQINEIDQRIINPITTLPDHSFYNVLVILLRNLDELYFEEKLINKDVALNIRETLINRMISSRPWKRLDGDESLTTEVHLGPAIAAIFFNDYDPMLPARVKCYLTPIGIKSIDCFLPLFENTVKTCAAPMVAVALLNLLEVAPCFHFMPLLCTAAKSWLVAFPELTSFWVDCQIGSRICLLIEKTYIQEPSFFISGQNIYLELDFLLSKLVSLGVAEASRLEGVLRDSCRTLP